MCVYPPGGVGVAEGRNGRVAVDPTVFPELRHVARKVHIVQLPRTTQKVSLATGEGELFPLAPRMPTPANLCMGLSYPPKHSLNQSIHEICAVLTLTLVSSGSER
jgi:hypothetical protein